MLMKSSHYNIKVCLKLDLLTRFNTLWLGYFTSKNKSDAHLAEEAVNSFQSPTTWIPKQVFKTPSQ